MGARIPALVLGFALSGQAFLSATTQSLEVMTMANLTVDQLVAQLRSETPFHRAVAASRLGTLRVSDPQAIAGLLVVLRDDDPHARRSAAEALSFIDASRFPQALRVLDAALQEDLLYLPGHPTMQALVKHGAAAVPVLVRQINRGDEFRAMALSVLTLMPVGTPGVREALRDAASGPDASGLSTAANARALGHLQPGDAAGEVEAALTSDDPRVRFAALTAAMADLASPDVMSSVRTIATDANDPIRPFALVFVAERDADFARAHVADLAALLTLADWIEPLRAVGVGSVSGDPGAQPASILGRLGADAREALPALRRVAEAASAAEGSSDVSARIAVARIEGRPVSSLVDAAVADLSHADDERRAVALLTLTHLGPDARSALGVLERLPKRGEPWDAVTRMAIAAIKGEAGAPAAAGLP